MRSARFSRVRRNEAGRRREGTARRGRAPADPAGSLARHARFFGRVCTLPEGSRWLNDSSQGRLSPSLHCSAPARRSPTACGPTRAGRRENLAAAAGDSPYRAFAGRPLALTMGRSIARGLAVKVVSRGSEARPLTRSVSATRLTIACAACRVRAARTRGGSGGTSGGGRGGTGGTVAGSGTAESGEGGWAPSGGHTNDSGGSTGSSGKAGHANGGNAGTSGGDSGCGCRLGRANDEQSLAGLMLLVGFAALAGSRRLSARNKR